MSLSRMPHWWRAPDSPCLYEYTLHRTQQRVNEEIFPVSVPPSEQAMLDEFLAAIRENREPECGARYNLGSLRMSRAVKCVR